MQVYQCEVCGKEELSVKTPIGVYQNGSLMQLAEIAPDNWFLVQIFLAMSFTQVQCCSLNCVENVGPILKKKYDGALIKT